MSCFCCCEKVYLSIRCCPSIGVFVRVVWQCNRACLINSIAKYLDSNCNKSEIKHSMPLQYIWTVIAIKTERAKIISNCNMLEQEFQIKRIHKAKRYVIAIYLDSNCN